MIRGIILLLQLFIEMLKNITNGIFILLGVLVLTLLIHRQCSRTVESERNLVSSNTTLHIRKHTPVTVDSLSSRLNAWKPAQVLSREVIRIENDTIYLDKPIDTAEVLAAYYGRYEYHTPYEDSNISIQLDQVVTQNRIEHTSLTYHWLRADTTRVISNTYEVVRAPRNQWFVGGFTGISKTGFSGGPQLTCITKSRRIQYTGSIDLMNRGGTFYIGFPITKP